MTLKKKETKKELRLGKEERVNAAKNKMKIRMGISEGGNHQSGCEKQLKSYHKELSPVLTNSTYLYVLAHSALLC